ncbi:hypothetical protein EW026_g3956 [Hermanssonia centrifuga]|uniref:Chaperone DnaJ C-terminal domain-containing protein n=1 Tax=Hermanssonia centrifuga TaxID=98765 RepID=A0A4S4KIM8_9APHY|nr:hypothetical protein EW026_g3956 [Hermanssonia centrifuga]
MCTDCSGEGERLREKDRCKKCKGNKIIKDKTRHEIFVERGMPDKHRITIAGAGDEEPGVPPGDVVFALRTRPHASFERSGNDLLTKVHITLSEALLGFSRIIVTHLDGRGIHIASPKGKIIKPGDSIVVRGEGMPLFKNPDQKGQLYVVFDVDMPDEEWLRTIDTEVLEAVLPPKKPELDPKPAVIDEVPFEESDIVDFGDDEADWESEESEGDGEPECRPQ